MLKALVATAAALAALAAVPAAAQQQARVNWVEVHSAAIAGNLEGNTAERKVLVVTPPGYDENPNKRYPVVYYLHGYWAPVEAQQQGFRLHEAVQAAAEAGNPMIMVMPDGFSKLRGGFYSSSPTVGDYESFVADDLVGWVDANYRTLAARASRGLAGHSMGGYGTARIAMKHPEVFSSIYMMSACCLDPMQMTAEQAKNIEAMTEADVTAAQFNQLAAVSTLATWSPDRGGVRKSNCTTRRFLGSSMRSILSSALIRLCTCAAFAACVWKRSMNRCSLASIACWRA